jgi:hypothetical protein
MILFKTPGTLLTAESRAYSFQGNEGTSHKVRVNVGGEIYSCRSTADQVSALKRFEGREGNLELAFESPKENVRVSLSSFSLLDSE